MNRHPNNTDLALFATGDAGWLRSVPIGRHVGTCPDCRAKVEEFRDLHDEMADAELDGVNWNRLASEMRANIRLGLEAGECVRHTEARTRWRLGLAAAAACIVFLAVAGYFLRDSNSTAQAPARPQAAVLRSTPSGVELSTGSTSLVLLNREGAVSSRTASAQGSVRSRSVDGETGAVTITNVYLAE